MGLRPVGSDVPPLGLQGQVQLRRVDVEVALEGIVVDGSTVAVVGRLGGIAKRRRLEDAPSSSWRAGWLLPRRGAQRANVVAGALLLIQRRRGVGVGAVARRRGRRCSIAVRVVRVGVVISGCGVAASRRQDAGIHSRLVPVGRADHGRRIESSV